MTLRVEGESDVVREFVHEARRAGKKVGVVMTMGALHEGHLSLVEVANRDCDATVVSVFVNPTQFGPHEDFEKYPRQLEADLRALSSSSVDVVFAPTVDQMYGDGHSTSVCAPSISEPWEGRCRPGHFDGVATVVLKLLQIVPADVAYFGNKDYQQVQVIRAMVRDLHVGTRIVGCPILRDPDGLAKSSRNAYMTDDERAQALALSQGLSAAAELFKMGERGSAALAARIRQQLAGAGITKIDYIAVVDSDTLVEKPNAGADSIALIASYVGETRLIDNCRLGDGPIVAP